MSLLLNSFPMADPCQQLIFAHPWQDRIDPVFAGRLAALGRYIGKKVNLFSGFRSREEQEESYRTSKPGYACRPGTSWHEFGMAVDAADAWLKALEKDASTDAQTTLRKFGLFKPLTKGNGQTVLEDWHIQPIETRGPFSVSEKQKYFYGYVGGIPMDIKTLQMITGLLPDGVVGPKTIAKAKEVRETVIEILKSAPSERQPEYEAAIKKLGLDMSHWKDRSQIDEYFDDAIIKISNMKG